MMVHIPYDGTESGLDAYRVTSEELISIFDALASQPDINSFQVENYAHQSYLNAKGIASAPNHLFRKQLVF